jgi:hypothetical protein
LGKRYTVDVGHDLIKCKMAMVFDCYRSEGVVGPPKTDFYLTCLYSTKELKNWIFCSAGAICNIYVGPETVGAV